MNDCCGEQGNRHGLQQGWLLTKSWKDFVPISNSISKNNRSFVKCSWVHPLFFFGWIFLSSVSSLFSVGWGQCLGWQGEAHTDLWGLQCQPKSPSAGQLAGDAFPVPPLSSTGVCDATFLSAWLCQPAHTVTHLSRNTHLVLQAGWHPKRADEDLGGRGEPGLFWTHAFGKWMFFCQKLACSQFWASIQNVNATWKKPKLTQYLVTKQTRISTFPFRCSLQGRHS